ncbi:MAG: class I SAM-dependent methyltransferase [Bacteroidota bacterium]
MKLSPRSKNLQIMTCPSCNSNDVKVYQYKEGTISLCRGCKLQWGEYNELFSRSTNSAVLHEKIREGIYAYYMNSNSISSAAHYSPYVSFFRFIGKKKPHGCLRILDIGCGNGTFIKECIRQGHDAMGIEIDANLRSVIPADILNRIIFSSVEKAQIPDPLFDIITFWDSFEHLLDGFEVLDNLRPHLKKGGLIYLRVNNNKDITNLLSLFSIRLFPEFGKKMLKICFGFPDHVWNFSKIGMSNLLNKRHWEIVLCRLSETPAERFAKNIFLVYAIRLGYLCNKIIGGGKIGEYYIIDSIKK